MSDIRLETAKLIWVRSFLLIAEKGTQQEAGQALRRKQSQISDDVKSLERWLGKKLLRPTDRNKLTDAGHEFVAIAREVVPLALASRSPSAPSGKTLSLVWLTAFLKVAECESISEAARQLGWTQPSVSRYVKKLGEWLGKTLFEELDPPVLHEDAKEFVPVATLILSKLEASRSPEAAARPRVSKTVHPKSPEELEFDVYVEIQKMLERGMEFRPKNKQIMEWYENMQKKHGRRYKRHAKS